MRPHMSSKVCSLAELTVTHTAMVRLWLIMHGTPVLLQATLKLKLCRTIRTEIFIIITVYLAHVTSQHRRQFELLPALGACKWPFVGMFQDDVPPQQGSPLKANSTLTADMWSEIKVNFLVRIPRTRLSKGFATDTTRIRPLTGVASHVLGEGRSKCTSTSTDAANIRLIFSGVMLAHVLLEEFQLPILFIALAAWMPLRPMSRILVMSQVSPGLKPTSTFSTAVSFCTSSSHSVWQDTKKFLSPILRSCFPQINKISYNHRKRLQMLTNKNTVHADSWSGHHTLTTYFNVQ